MKITRLRSVTAGDSPVSEVIDVTDIPMQPASLDIWDKKYRLASKDGRAIDETIDGTYQRVARALAAELKSVGITMDFAPVLDVLTRPSNPAISSRWSSGPRRTTTPATRPSSN